MATLAAFLAISAAAVAVMLRFLFALESDIRSTATHPALTRVYVYHARARAVPVLALVYSNPKHVLRARTGALRALVLSKAQSKASSTKEA